jgi:hypothetical protein
MKKKLTGLEEMEYVLETIDNVVRQPRIAGNIK